LAGYATAKRRGFTIIEFSIIAMAIFLAIVFVRLGLPR
jgi:hypothetical protein